MREKTNRFQSTKKGFFCNYLNLIIPKTSDEMKGVTQIHCTARTKKFLDFFL